MRFGEVVTRRAHNPEITGSNPVGATTIQEEGVFDLI
jgi:hypothetical protein